MGEDILNYFTNCHVSWDTLYNVVSLSLNVLNLSNCINPQGDPDIETNIGNFQFTENRNITLVWSFSLKHRFKEL